MGGESALRIVDVEEPTLGLDLPKGQSFEEWVQVGRNLANGSKVLNWWIGDWWAAGSHRYGERAKIAATGIFGREFQSLADMASVCRAFPTSRRREHLSFSHHREVASLPPEQADDLLERAELDGWTRNDIRAEASALRTPHAGAGIYDRNPETLEWSALRGLWNRVRVSVRQRFIDEVDGTAPLQ